MQTPLQVAYIASEVRLEGNPHCVATQVVPLSYAQQLWDEKEVERAIVNRCWKALGIETYQQAKPLAIDEHIVNLRQQLTQLSSSEARLRKLLDEIGFYCAGNAIDEKESNIIASKVLEALSGSSSEALKPWVEFVKQSILDGGATRMDRATQLLQSIGQ